MSTVPHRII